ncbi:MAG TPA: hypothetical protein VMD59_04320 [Acidimicrobiales bacterium]|nr:hypothetical protein [Acidimicrobiales bacterium]
MDVDSLFCCEWNRFSSAGDSVVGYATWHPGETLRLPWLFAEPLTGRTWAPPVEVSLSVQLVGPFASVKALKSIMSAAAPFNTFGVKRRATPLPRSLTTVTASVAHTWTDAQRAPVSLLSLPARLRAGLYDLSARVVGYAFAGGSALVTVKV